MYLERCLQISMAAFAAMGTVLLGMGEDSVALPIAAIVVSCLSVCITDIKGWLRLNRLTADLAGVAAMAISIAQWQGDLTEGQLLALVNFVVYVQFVLLFKQKTTRSYWLLALLSVLQVAVATALNESLEFGVLMVAYMFVGLLTMTLFFLHRECGRFRAGAIDPAANAAEPLAIAASLGSLSVRPEGDTMGSAPPSSVRARWPLVGQSTAFTGVAAAAEMDEGVGWELFWRTSLLAVATLIWTMAFFYSMPRLEKWSRPSSGGEEGMRQISLPQEVTLGELGRVIESPEEAMRVYLTDHGSPLSLAEEPYFRASVLAEYASNRWGRMAGADSHYLPQRTINANTSASIQQTIEMRLPATPEVPSLYPPIVPINTEDVLKDRDSATIGFNRETEQIVRQAESPGKRLVIYLPTTGIRDSRQIQLISSTHEMRDRDRETYMTLPRTSAGADPLAGTREIALGIVANIDQSDSIGRAQALEAFLRDSTEFSYELQPIPRDAGVDPVEDFVTRHRIGHCEFFASALALMLRQVGIPSRLVVGYKGGEWTDQSYYLVRNLHAHAWVEAYIEPRDDLKGTENDAAARKNGAWLSLDPTSARDSSQTMLVSMSQNIKQFLVYWRASWSAYVLGMDAQRQQESVYQPVSQGAVRLVKGFFDADFWASLLAELKNLPRRWGLADGGWFSWRGALVAIVVMLLLVSLYRGVSWLTRRVLSWRRRRAASAERRGVAKVEFYRRLENILAQHQLVRSTCQTQREFALVSGGQLAESPETKGVAALPRHIVEAYYKVRFGGRPLDSAESQAVEQALSELAAALSPARRTRST